MELCHESKGKQLSFQLPRRGHIFWAQSQTMRSTLQVKFLFFVQEFLPSRTGVPPLFAARTVNRQAR